MIAKHVSMRALQKANYGELVKYLVDPKDKVERVGLISITNCHADNPHVAALEVMNCQAQNKRARADPTYHLIFSFPPGERPKAETLQAIEERLCAGLGFREHQRVSVVHHDTDSLHVHVAISTVHPTRYTMHTPHRDYRTLAGLCTKLESEYGLQETNHVAQKRGAENRANDMEAHTGVQSLLGWIKQECAQQMQGAQSWEQLHQVMREHGLQLRERGNGLIVVAADGTVVKASSINRSYSKQGLENRFGKFESGPKETSGVTAVYRAQPVRPRVNTAELFARYQEAQRTSTAGRAAAIERIRKDKQQAIEEAKRVASLKRAAIKASQEPGSIKKILYSAAHKTLRNDLGNIAEQFAQERARIAAAHQRRAWADWLQAQALQGDAEALEAMRGRPGPKATGPVDGITKSGTIIYRFGATAVRDDGSRLAISRGADLAGLEDALKMAAQRFGPVIAVTGTDVFKARIAEAAARSGLAITFSTPALEQRRQQLLSETDHDRSRARTDGGRTSRSSPGSRRPVAARAPGGPAGAGTTEQHARGAARTARPAKPDVGAVGRKPPPEAQHHLRGLQQLGVVQFAHGSEVLLPSHVSRDVEHKGPEPDHPLRRDLSGPGAGLTSAAQRYLEEREAKRARGIDIPRHLLADPQQHDGPVTFAGLREIDGQRLALLKRADDILILPIDADTAERLARVKVGASLTMTDHGALRTRGLRR